jgi:hypothetical protein
MEKFRAVSIRKIYAGSGVGAFPFPSLPEITVPVPNYPSFYSRRGVVPDAREIGKSQKSVKSGILSLKSLSGTYA